MGTPEQDEVAKLLKQISEGDPDAGRRLLPIVYDDLRRMAHRRMRHEPRGLTLEATALVHEAYLRLVANEGARWDSRGHFFASAAEAMRRILVERARRYSRKKHGGGRSREPLNDLKEPSVDLDPDELLALDAALKRLEQENEVRAQVVKLRYFAGLTIDQTADALGVSSVTVTRHWTCARAWLHHEMSGGGSSGKASDE